MKVIAGLFALVSLVSASPATSESQVSSLGKRALPSGWNDCGALADPVQVTSFVINPEKPKWEDTITVSNIEGKVRKTFLTNTLYAKVEISIISKGTTIPITIRTPSTCATFYAWMFGWFCATVPTLSGTIPSGGSASFSPSQMLASQPSLKATFDEGVTIGITIRIMNDYDGQQLDCVTNPKYVA
jgi:hypothetical protein